MRRQQEAKNLEELLDQLCEAPPEGDRVMLDSILGVVGRRSFGPLLLLAGLVMVAPIIGDIPGVPVLMGLLILLVAGQLLFHREHIWVPHWLLNRSVTRDKLSKTVGWVQTPARFVDRFLRPRLTALTNRTAQYVVAAVCAIIAALTPVMEVVPFSANVAGAAITAFGLSLISHDGVLALIAFAFTATTVGLLVYNLL